MNAHDMSLPAAYSTTPELKVGQVVQLGDANST